MLAPWIGGAASVDVAPASGGMRSLLAFWAGGAMSGAVTPEPAPVVAGSNDDGIYLKQRIRDDDEIAQLLTIIFPHL